MAYLASHRISSQVLKLYKKCLSRMLMTEPISPLRANTGSFLGWTFPTWKPNSDRRPFVETAEIQLRGHLAVRTQSSKKPRFNLFFLACKAICDVLAPHFISLSEARFDDPDGIAEFTVESDKAVPHDRISYRRDRLEVAENLTLSRSYPPRVARSIVITDSCRRPRAGGQLPALFRNLNSRGT